MPVMHGREFAPAAHHEAFSRLLEVLVGAVNLYWRLLAGDTRIVGPGSWNRRTKFVTSLSTDRLGRVEGLTIKLVREGIVILRLGGVGTCNIVSSACVTS